MSLNNIYDDANLNPMLNLEESNVLEPIQEITVTLNDNILEPIIEQKEDKLSNVLDEPNIPNYAPLNSVYTTGPNNPTHAPLGSVY